jgi:hypothetical protein
MWHFKGCFAMKCDITLGGLHWGRNCDVAIGRAERESCLSVWNLGTNSAFALGPSKTIEE